MFPQDQIDELKLFCVGVSTCQDGGVTYLVITGLALPAGCTLANVDALLCPTARDGYPSRLFFAEQVESPVSRNWNFSGRICERNWRGFSWKVGGPDQMRVAQLVRAHLDGLRGPA
jgi:hypothetical protein